MRVAGRETAEANSYPALRPRWCALLDGFVAMGEEPRDRSEPGARAVATCGRATRWARLLASRPRRAGRPRLLRTRPGPVAGRACRRGDGEGAEARPSASRTIRRTSRSSTSGRPGSRATSARSCGIARRRGAPIVVNQDGVAYPGWAGDARRGVEPAAPTRRSSPRTTSCTRASSRGSRPTRFLGAPDWPSEVLHNAVDVAQLHPGRRAAGGRAGAPPRRRPDAGVPARARAPDARGAARPSRPDAQLLVTGRLVSAVEPLVAELGLAGRVHLVGAYAQRDAPAIFRRAHLLLHTKVKDPCPTLVVEAMACGLPVVHPASGGTRRARRRRGRDRRASSRHVGARTCRRRPRSSPKRSIGCSPTCRATRPRRVRARSSASRSSRGSSVTRRSSRASRPGSRGPSAERGELVAGAGAVEPQRARASVPPTGRTSIRPTTRPGSRACARM